MIIGVDEVGKGACAGPLVVCAYKIMPHGFRIVDIKDGDKFKDSKALTKLQRERIVRAIEYQGHYSLSAVPASYIDKYGITAAWDKAVECAVSPLYENGVHEVFLDGKFAPRSFMSDLGPKYRCVVKGDTKVYEIACASIIAKVYRDSLMASHPDANKYGWGRNSGYLTEDHRNAISAEGLSDEHRRTFVQKVR